MQTNVAGRRAVKPALALAGVGMLVLGSYVVVRIAWLGGSEIVIGLLALLALSARPKSTAYAGIVLGVATLLMWLVAVARGLVGWLSTLTFVGGIAFASRRRWHRAPRCRQTGDDSLRRGAPGRLRKAALVTRAIKKPPRNVKTSTEGAGCGRCRRRVRSPRPGSRRRRVGRRTPCGRARAVAADGRKLGDDAVRGRSRHFLGQCREALAKGTRAIGPNLELQLATQAEREPGRKSPPNPTTGLPYPSPGPPPHAPWRWSVSTAVSIALSVAMPTA